MSDLPSMAHACTQRKYVCRGSESDALLVGFTNRTPTSLCFELQGDGRYLGDVILSEEQVRDLFLFLVAHVHGTKGDQDGQ